MIAMNSSSKQLLPAYTGVLPCSQAPRGLRQCSGQGHSCMTRERDNSNQGLVLHLGNPECQWLSSQ